MSQDVAHEGLAAVIQHAEHLWRQCLRQGASSDTEALGLSISAVANLLSKFSTSIINTVVSGHDRSIFQEILRRVAIAFRKASVPSKQDETIKELESVTAQLSGFHKKCYMPVLRTLFDEQITSPDNPEVQRPGGSDMKYLNHWALLSPEYIAWLQEPAQTLLCTGIPGSGKTTLVSIIADELKDIYHKIHHEKVETKILVLYFESLGPTSLDNVLGLLLRQLIPGLSETDSAHLMGSELLQRVIAYIQTCARVFILIDALDQCTAVDNTDRYRSRLIPALQKIQTDSKANILITSRTGLDLNKTFPKLMGLEIRAHDEDVRNYVFRNTTDLDNLIHDGDDLQNEMACAVASVAGGSFTIAHYFLDFLDGQYSLEDIRFFVPRLREEGAICNDYWARQMGKIKSQPSEQRQYAQCFLNLVFCAYRPLTPLELGHAVAVYYHKLGKDPLPRLEKKAPGAEEILSYCAGLVRLDSQTGTFRLAHDTIHGYFQKHQAELFPEAHTWIAEICLKYLSLNPFGKGPCSSVGDFEKRLQTYHFYSYAATYWGKHARVSGSPIMDKAVTFLERDRFVDASAQVFVPKSQAQRFPSNAPYTCPFMTGRRLAAYFGLEEALSRLGRFEDANKACYHPSALALAAEHGHLDCVNHLLSQGDHLNHGGIGRGNKSWLLYAAGNGHHEIIWSFLKVVARVNMGVEINRQGIGYEGGFGTTALMEAVKNDHVEIASSLIKNGADKTLQAIHGNTALHWAVDRGNEDMVRLLLQGENNINQKADHGTTPLHWAAQFERPSIVKLLISHGADINARDADEATPLHIAAMFWNEGDVAALLDAGAVVNSLTKYEVTPLDRAYETWNLRDDGMSSEFTISYLRCHDGLRREEMGNVDVDVVERELRRLTSDVRPESS